jgi:pimeloyl-ACP methyl ester carboxylesterase
MSADSTASVDGGYTLVDVGGYRLAIHCIGERSPTVVLETGFGAPSEYWAPIQQEISGLTRVCRFDRAGRGQSDPAPTTPRTCADMVTCIFFLSATTGRGVYGFSLTTWGATVAVPRLHGGSVVPT